MTETEWTNKIVKLLREKYKAMVQVLHGNNYTQSGWPDRLIVMFDDIFLIEFKGPKTPVTPLQRNTLKELSKRAPNNVFICRQIDKDEDAGMLCSVEGVPLSKFSTLDGFIKALDEAAK